MPKSCAADPKPLLSPYKFSATQLRWAEVGQTINGACVVCDDKGCPNGLLSVCQPTRVSWARMTTGTRCHPQPVLC